jgi:NADPH-dependent ferric siderophore reductase
MTFVRYRPFHVRVVRAHRLSPSFRRLTFTGHDLATFGAGGFDQRIKVILPGPAGSLADMPSGDDWYDRWRDLPDDRRPVLRTFTVRAARPGRSEVDVDFVLHCVDDGHAGPASRWAAAARPGDEAILLGPDRPGRGRAWGCEWAPPPHARRLLLAGDETAVPAVSAVLEGLPDGAGATALLEVPTSDDQLPVALPDGAELRWFARRCGDRVWPHGEQLTRAVRETVAGWAPPRAASAGPVEDDDTTILWDVADAEVSSDDLYVWVAGEASVVSALRRHLRGDLGLPRGCAAFMGYWRRGRAEQY